MKKVNEDDGFMLVELLVVVTIMGILTAISIPTYSRLMEKSRETVDAANIRTAYAELMMDASEGDSTEESGEGSDAAYQTEVSLIQEHDGWQTNQFKDDGIGIEFGKTSGKQEPTANGKATISVVYGESGEPEVQISYGSGEDEEGNGSDDEDTEPAESEDKSTKNTETEKPSEPDTEPDEENP